MKVLVINGVMVHLTYGKVSYLTSDCDQAGLNLEEIKTIIAESEDIVVVNMLPGNEFTYTKFNGEFTICTKSDTEHNVKGIDDLLC